MNSFIEHFKSRIEIDGEMSSLISNIILTDNIQIKKNNFAKFTKIAAEDNEKNLLCTLLLYSLDIHKEFKTELNKLLRSKIKDYNSTLKKFFKVIDLNSITSKETNNIKFKILLLNNAFDLQKKNGKFEEELYQTFYTTYVQFFLNGDAIEMIKDINDELAPILVLCFNSFISCVNLLQTKDKDSIQKLFFNLSDNVKSGKVQIEFGKKTRDIIFSYSNLIFFLCSYGYTFEEYCEISLKFLNELSLKKQYETLIIYTKSFINNCDIKNLDAIKEKHLTYFNNFIDEKLTLNNDEKDITKYHNCNLMQFYKAFLTHNFKGKYSLLINEIFLLYIIRKIKEKVSISEITNDNELIDQIFTKIRKDKENFSYIEENFFLIIQSLSKCEGLESKISLCIEKYINNLISIKEKPLLNECQLFPYLSKNSTKIFIDFLELLFSFSFDKKDVALISEYTKIFFHFTEKNKALFTETYPKNLLDYLIKIYPNEVKWFNNFFVSIEKINNTYLALIINEAFERTKKNFEYFNILFGLLKPFRNQKKVLFVENGEIRFSHTKSGCNFIIKISDLSAIIKSNNDFIISVLLEFINEFDNYNEIFPLIFGVIKYDLKTSNAEFKASATKSIKVYFDTLFVKLTKFLNKNKKDEKEKVFIQKAFDNILKLIQYLSDNIYDRPVEKLLPMLEILSFSIEFINKVKGDLKKGKETEYEEFLKVINSILYTDGLCISLISLLKHSWFFVRNNSFNILKSSQYKEIISQKKNELISEINKYAFSLRQMDAEGAAYLFILMIHHLGKDFLNDALKEIFGYSGTKVLVSQEDEIVLNSIEIFMEISNSKEETYLNCLAETNAKYNNTSFDIKNKSIHFYFIFIKTFFEISQNSIIRNILTDESKVHNEKAIALLFKLSSVILSLNDKFIKYLINNGVSEFSTTDDEYVDNEDKVLISLWCTSKYSLNILSFIYDIFTKNYPSIFSTLSNEKFETIFLIPLGNSLEMMSHIITTSKHMGVVKSLNECLYKICLILNKSPEEFKKYTLLAKQKIENFISEQLPNEEISSTLRRSAGIPFLIVSLIKSYITPSYSNSYINSILSFSVKTLLDCFTKYQYDRVDGAVHCLHILRVISDDTLIKPYIRNYYNEIIIKIVDGLQSSNWSIKNACMLMFSRVIKNNFLIFGTTGDPRNLPTFVEYFLGKANFYKVCKEILSKHCNGVVLNDCLLLFVTFFTKFKPSKPSEYENKELIEVAELLFKMGSKDNKLFRKLLTSAIMKNFGKNHNRLILKLKNDMKEHKNKKEEGWNNRVDFYYNVINEIIKQSEVNAEVKADLIKEFESCIGFNDNYFNCFELAKFIQLYKKIITEEEIPKVLDNNKPFISHLGLDHADKTINLSVLMKNLKENSRIFSYFKYIKHSLSLLLTHKYTFRSNLTSLLAELNELKLEELFVFLLKKHMSSLQIGLFSLDMIDLNSYNVNISSKIAVYILKNIPSISQEVKTKLLKQILTIMEKETQKTKLISKLFPLMNRLLSEAPSEEEISLMDEILSVILSYTYSHNLDNLRISAVLAFEDIVKYMIQKNCLNKVNSLTLLKISFLMLNDDFQGIRMKCSEVFDKIDEVLKIVKWRKSIVRSSKGFSNEYIMKKILKNGDLENNSIKMKEFFDYVKDTNFYIVKDNSVTKVFFFEPDNRYIDNVEIKILIARSELKRVKENSEEPSLSSKDKKIDPFITYEEFCEIIKENYKKIISYNLNISNDRKYLYTNRVRRILYK